MSRLRELHTTVDAGESFSFYHLQSKYFECHECLVLASNPSRLCPKLVYLCWAELILYSLSFRLKQALHPCVLCFCGHESFFKLLMITKSKYAMSAWSSEVDNLSLYFVPEAMVFPPFQNSDQSVASGIFLYLLCLHLAYFWLFLLKHWVFLSEHWVLHK